MTPTREQIEAARQEAETLLSDTCTCGHHKVDDHFHGECEECDCVMPDMSEDLDASLRLLRTLLAATAQPTDEVELDRSAIFRAAEDAYHNGPRGNRCEGERKRLAGEAIIAAVLTACGKRERVGAIRKVRTKKRETCHARDGECESECPQKTHEEPICAFARRNGCS